jgi:MSHA biogenesis protein MshM
MYLKFYGLKKPPFRILPDSSLFYTGGRDGRGVLLEALSYAIQTGEGILKVVGEVGSGKTMLCRMLVTKLPASIQIVYIANPSISKEQVLYIIAHELALGVSEDTSRLQVMQKLQEYLIQRHANGGSVLVIIEEAQSMPIETLEELRLFVNLETHEAKLMQLVLFGQPELDKNLEQNSIRQLRERITHSFYLKPLSAEDTAEYIKFRLTSAGCPDSNVFSERAVKMVASASKGLTRRINIIADKAMLAAFAESPHQFMPSLMRGKSIPAVYPKHVRAALKDTPYQQTKIWNYAIVGLSVLIVAVLARLAFLLSTNADTIHLLDSTF